MQIHKGLRYICIMYSSELLKGTLKTLILKLLSEQPRMYGYEITQKIKVLSEGKINITEGALYPTLHKLEAAGWLATEKVNLGKRVRKYYSLTPKGNRAAEALIQEFSEFLMTMRRLIGLDSSSSPQPETA